MDQTSIDALRALPVSPRGHFIDGQSVPAIEGGMRNVTSPIDGQVLTQIAEGSPADMTRAIASARAAFEDGRWSRMAPAARKKVLLKLADLIESQALELAVLGVRDNGTEINMAIKAESMSAAATFRYYGEAIDKVYGQIAPTAENVLGLVASCARRCRWGDCAMEFPADDRVVENRARAGCWQFHRVETSRKRVAQPAAHRRTCLRGWCT